MVEWHAGIAADSDDEIHYRVARRRVHLLPRDEGWTNGRRCGRQGNEADRARDDENGDASQCHNVSRGTADQLLYVSSRPGDSTGRAEFSSGIETYATARGATSAVTKRNATTANHR